MCTRAKLIATLEISIVQNLTPRKGRKKFFLRMLERDDVMKSRERKRLCPRGLNDKLDSWSYLHAIKGVCINESVSRGVVRSIHPAIYNHIKCLQNVNHT